MNSILKIQLSLAFLLVQMTAQAAQLKTGDIAPEIVLPGILANGQPVVSSVTASPGPEQSYTLVQFFKTDSAAAAESLFPLSELAVDIEEHVATHLVAVDAEIADVKAYVKNNKTDIKFPVHFDNRQNAMRAFGVTETPAIFVLKNEKEVLFTHNGVLTESVIEQIRTAVGYR